MTLSGAVAGLAALAVFQAVGNAALVTIVVALAMSPENAASFRRWLANVRERVNRRV